MFCLCPPSEKPQRPRRALRAPSTLPAMASFPLVSRLPHENAMAWPSDVGYIAIFHGDIIEISWDRSFGQGNSWMNGCRLSMVGFQQEFLQETMDATPRIGVLQICPSTISGSGHPTIKLGFNLGNPYQLAIIEFPEKKCSYGCV